MWVCGSQINLCFHACVLYPIPNMCLQFKYMTWVSSVIIDDKIRASLLAISIIVDLIFSKGMRRFDARRAVLEALKEKDLYRGTKPNPMVVPTCR